MSTKVTNLWVGFDLGETYSQLSCYNARREDVDSICLPGHNNATEIPVCLAKSTTGDSWLYGLEAQARHDDHVEGWIFLRGFLYNYDTEPVLEVQGQQFEKKELLFRFISMCLELLKLYYPHGEVQWLTFTAKDYPKTMIWDLLEFGQRLGIMAGCTKIQRHVASYEIYALCQPKELWSHDVGLFEYDRDGLSYIHLTINRRRLPMVVTSQTLDLSAYLNGEDYKNLPKEELDRRFFNVIKEVLGKRNVSTVYLVGEGFASSWMSASVSTMCVNRKGFIGQNLFSRGACYNSMLEATHTKNQNFIAMCDDMIPVNIFLSVTRGRENLTVDLVKAGSDWYNVRESTEFILDGTDTVPLKVKEFVSGREYVIPVTLTNLPDRPNRTTRIRMHLEFEDSQICQVIMEDCGFGALYPATDKTWKMRLNVVEYEKNKEYAGQGRLILNREPAEAAPYYFHISGMKVYSAEELCYYIYENIYAVTLDTFNEELLYWLEKDMNEPVMARGIKNMIRAGGGLKEILRYFMNLVDYYSPQECQKLLMIVDELAHQNPTEAKKLAADNFVRYCRYMEAVREYNNVIYDMENKFCDELTREFKGDTWHNLGVAYTRLLNFKAAQRCFKMAWRQNHRDDSLKCLLWTSKLIGDESEFFDAVEASDASPEEIEAIVGVYEQAETDSKSSQNDRLRAVRAMYQDNSGDAWIQKRDAYIDEQKEIYRN